MATNQYPSVQSVLSAHGFASEDDARAANVTFGCFVCGSIAEVTASDEMERRVQASLIEWSCCDPGDDFIL